MGFYNRGKMWITLVARCGGDAPEGRRDDCPHEDDETAACAVSEGTRRHSQQRAEGSGWSTWCSSPTKTAGIQFGWPNGKARQRSAGGVGSGTETTEKMVGARVSLYAGGWITGRYTLSVNTTKKPMQGGKGSQRPN